MDKGEAHMLTLVQFEHYWPLISTEMDKVRDVWEIWWTKEAIHDAVMNGYMNVWVVGSEDTIYFTLFTQIVRYPANTILKIVLLVGNSLEKYYDIAEAVLEKFALGQGCSFMETCARDGFKRRIKNASHHGVLLTRKVGTIRVQ